MEPGTTSRDKWIIAGTALVVTLLMLVSQLASYPERAQQRVAFGSRAPSLIDRDGRLEFGCRGSGHIGPAADLAEEIVALRE